VQTIDDELGLMKDLVTTDSRQQKIIAALNANQRRLVPHIPDPVRTGLVSRPHVGLERVNIVDAGHKIMMIERLRRDDLIDPT
jgi:hypothetical protein